MTRWITRTSVLIASFGVGMYSAAAAEPKTLADGLDNPVGVAVDPQSGDVLVSANKAIHRLVKANGYKGRVQVDGFATDVYGKGPMYDIGPLGLIFADGMLVVGGGDLVDGKEVVRFFDAETLKQGKPAKVDDACGVSGPIGPGSESVKGEGNFYALVQIGSDIFVTCNGDDTKGWISKIELKSGKPSPLIPFIATKEKLNVDAPCGIATKDGKLVVSQMGEINVPGDSLLTVYDPKTGALEKNLKTGLDDLISIAYSPKTGHLYGVDFSWHDVSKGGLYRLEMDGDHVKATKLGGLMKPTALAIDKEGNAFVTILGAKEDGGGKVLVFKGL